MKHTWTYANIGGNTRVVIKNGKDIHHLAELDEKLWTVLACPTAGLEIPEESLQCMDTNCDSKIHVADVVATAEWLCKVLRDPQVLFEGKAALALTDIKDDAILAVATPLSVDGVVTLEGVKGAKAAVVVGSLPSADVAKSYLMQFVKNAEIKNALKGVSYRNIVISDDNLKVLQETGNINVYMELLKKVYLGR